jgi:hypothetical protein
MKARQWMNMKTSQEPPAQFSHQWGALRTLLDKGGGSQTLPTPSGCIYVPANSRCVQQQAECRREKTSQGALSALADKEERSTSVIKKSLHADFAFTEHIRVQVNHQLLFCKNPNQFIAGALLVLAQ